MKQQRSERDSNIFSKDYWDIVFAKVLMRVCVIAISVTIIGVLITPVIMSVVYSCRWMFLYLAYLAIIIFAFVYDGRYDD